MISENLDIFFSDFTVTAQINGANISVIFDDYHERMNLKAEGRQITATLKKSEVENTRLRREDTIVIDGINFKVVAIKPIMDGQIFEVDLLA